MKSLACACWALSFPSSPEVTWAKPKCQTKASGTFHRLDSAAKTNKVTLAFFLVQFFWTLIHNYKHSLGLEFLPFNTEIVIHYEEQIWKPSSLWHSGADLTMKWQHFSFRTLSGYAVHFCQLLRTELDLWCKCITTNHRYALGQLQCSVTPGLLLFQEL